MPPIELFLIASGEVGEIYVAGAGVAAGYLGLPDLTAQRFVPDRLSAIPGRRMYRSGDRGRIDASGELECLGRIDDQVKIRGHRIELGEIRSVLQSASSVTAAAVLARQDPGTGDSRIDAYVVAPGDADPVPALKAMLASRLPHYMLPSSITRLPKIPLNPNGKLDTGSLPVPSPGVGPGPAPDAAAADAGIARLAGIWFDLLGTWPSAGDSFFELGGNSLLVARLKTMIARAGLTPPSLRELYEHSTLAAMAEIVGPLQAAQQQLPAVRYHQKEV